jgi:tRNA pseudouridine38-40 synthase
LIQRYFIHLAYCGAAYRGWQRHPQMSNVQGTLEDALAQVLGHKVELTGCGRTDARVHASQFFVHADLERDLGYDLLFRWNKNLPADIVVYEMFPVHAKAHARYEATSRCYDYYIHRRANPFLEGLSTLVEHRDLNVSAMAQACQHLLLATDYRNLCKTPAQHSNTLCHISDAAWFKSSDGQRLRFRIRSNRFLRGMIRIIMHEMLQIGCGCSTSEHMESRLIGPYDGGERQLAAPQGLYLSEVQYPFIQAQPRDELFGPVGSQGSWQLVSAKD